MSTQADMSASARLTRLLQAVYRFQRADTERRRAINAADPERINRAGGSYVVAKFKLFKAADEANTLPASDQERKAMPEVRRG